MPPKNKNRNTPVILLALILAGFGVLEPVGGATFADAEYLIDSWETDQGLPENSVTAMVQTPDGYLWLSTFNGLVRFDGLNFTVFDPSNTPELPSPGIVNLHLDTSRRLWVSTYRGLVLSAPDRWTAFQTVPGWTGDYVRTFSEGAGVMCVTSFNGKVFRAQAGRWEELPEPPGKKGAGYLGYVDPAGGIWVGQIQTAYFGHWDGRQWTRPALSGELHPGFLTLTGLRDGRLLIVKDKELVYVDQDRIVLRLPLRASRPIGDAWGVTQDSRGDVWISSQGLYQVKPSGDVRYFSKTNGLTYDGLRCTFEDREGNLWAGSSGGGLMRFKPRTFMTYDEEHGLTERNIKAVLAEAPDKILLGAYRTGLFRWDHGRIAPLAAEQQPAARWAQCLLRDREQNLWIGSYSGDDDLSPLTILTPTGRRTVSSANCGGTSVAALFQDSRGRIWIGGGRTVSVFAETRFTPQNSTHDVSLRDVRCFAEDTRQGDIWAGGGEGLSRFAAGQWHSIKDAAGKRLGEVNCLRFEANGSLWIGGVGVGLLRLKDGRWSSVEERHGFPGNRVSSILEDDLGHWWLGSNRGIIRAARRDLTQVADGALSRLACQVFNLSDGLASVECAMGMQSNAAKDSAGGLWFATLKGVTMVDPNQLRLNTNPPPVRLETLSYLDRQGRRVSVAADRTFVSQVPATSGAQSPLKISPGSSQLEVRLATLSFTAPEKVKMKYQLVRDKQPFLSDEGPQRTISARWLPPGDYRLEVTAANNDGIWNEKGIQLAFTVQPFYWQTLWFKILGVLAFGAGVAGLAEWLHRDRLKRTEERLQQQEALAQERARSAALTQHASDAVVLLSAEGRVIYESASTTKLLGYSPGYFLEKDPIRFVHPEDVVRVRKTLRAVVQSTEPGILMGFRFRHARGHWLQLESLFTNLLAHPGVGGILAATRDVTERKRAEEALAESQERILALVESTPDMIWTVDPHEFGLLSFNSALKNYFSHFRNLEIRVGMTPDQLLPPEHALQMREFYARALREGSFVTEYLSPSETHTLLLSFYRLKRGGDVSGISVFGKDITEQKGLEEKFRQAQKMEAVGQLAGGVAHDFSNILAAILMHLSLLRFNAHLSVEEKEMLKELETEAKRAANLTRQLLMFSRRQIMQVKSLDLNDLLADLHKMLKRIIGEHIALTYEGGAVPLWIEADAGMMEQVVMNLCINARDAMPHSGGLTLGARKVEITEETARKNPDARSGVFVCLSVADTGCGMDASTVQRIFEPFFTTKAVGKGTGLGLATVYGIVKQHQGWIEVESRVGHGSLFRVYFPASSKTADLVAPSGMEMAPGGSEVILLVEDERSLRKVGALCLRSKGYEVLEAANGVDAVKVWDQHRDRIDLLVSDMVMPEGMTGLELSERLRCKKPSLKVVITSGYSDELSVQDRRAAAGITFLAKPYEGEILARIVRQCLDQS